MTNPEDFRTDETHRNRTECIAAIFERWKERACPHLILAGHEPCWRPDVIKGTEFGPKRITEVYFGEYRPAMTRLMKDSAHLLDRHKIVALTQKVIMEKLPITITGYGKFNLNQPPDGIVVINASFAYYFGIHFLSRWHEIR
jgi:hypothetical protein